MMHRDEAIYARADTVGASHFQEQTHAAEVIHEQFGVTKPMNNDRSNYRAFPEAGLVAAEAAVRLATQLANLSVKNTSDTSSPTKSPKSSTDSSEQ